MIKCEKREERGTVFTDKEINRPAAADADADAGAALGQVGTY